MINFLEVKAGLAKGGERKEEGMESKLFKMFFGFCVWVIRFRIAVSLMAFAKK